MTLTLSRLITHICPDALLAGHLYYRQLCPRRLAAGLPSVSVPVWEGSHVRQRGRNAEMGKSGPSENLALLNYQTQYSPSLRTPRV